LPPRLMKFKGDSIISFHFFGNTNLLTFGGMICRVRRRW
jgi:hypothetical protein